MKIKLNSEILVFVAAFFMMLGNQNAIRTNLGDIILYVGLGLFMLMIWWPRKFVFSMEILKKAIYAFLLFMLMSIGILKQGLNLSKVVTLLISYGMIISFYIFSGDKFNNPNFIRKMSYGVIWAVVCGSLVSIITRTPLIVKTTEGFDWAVTLGMGHKNLYSVCLFAAFCGLFISDKWISSKKYDKIILISLMGLLLLSGSRTTLIMLIIFLVFVNVDILRIIQKKYRTLFMFVIILFGIAFACYLFKWLLLNSRNFSIRWTGFSSYFESIMADRDSLLFGQGDVVYNTSSSYFHNVWLLTGGNGTFEMGILNIIAKQGLFGLFAYIIMIGSSIIHIKNEKNFHKRIALLSIIMPFLASAFVEQTIQNITVFYTVFSWIMISSFRSNSLWTNEIN